MIGQVMEVLRKTFLDSSCEFNEETAIYISRALDENIPEAFSVETGASKFCIIPEAEDYVIKIPFNCTTEGYTYWDLEEDEETKSRAYEPLYGADVEGEECWNYCALEVQNYQKAENKGLSCYFAPESKYGTVNDYPVYIQSKCVTCHGDKQQNTHISEALYQHLEKTCDTAKCDIFNPHWIADFLAIYGEAEFIKLMQFLHQNHMDEDLRDCNIGYLRGAPVLVDYSGYEG